MSEFILGGNDPRERFLAAWRAVRAGTFMAGHYADEATTSAIIRIAEELARGRFSDDPKENARIKARLEEGFSRPSLRKSSIVKSIKFSLDRAPARWSGGRPSPLMRTDRIREKRKIYGPGYEWWDDADLSNLKDSDRS